MENQEEVWKPIEDFDYEISSNGIVRRTSSKAIKKQILESQGYFRVFLYKGGRKTYPRSVHRVFAIAFIPNPENKPQVNHINGIKTDNRIENLEWNTHSENQLHAVRTGLRKVKTGQDNRTSKLNNQKVVEIRQIGKSKTLSFIAKMYGVSTGTISQILNRKEWNHI